MLDLLRVAIAAGLAPRRALAEVGRRHPGLLAAELERAAARAAMGEPAEQTLDEPRAALPRHRHRRARRRAAPSRAPRRPARRRARRPGRRGALAAGRPPFRAGGQGRAEDPARRRAAARPGRAAARGRGADPGAHDTLTPRIPPTSSPGSAAEALGTAMRPADRALQRHVQDTARNCTNPSHIEMPANRHFSTVEAPTDESLWDAVRVLCCRVGRCGVLSLSEAVPGWRGSSHSATPDRLTSPSASRSDMRLGLHRHLRTQPRRQEPADHPVEVPGGAQQGRLPLARRTTSACRCIRAATYTEMAERALAQVHEPALRAGPRAAAAALRQRAGDRAGFRRPRDADAEVPRARGDRPRGRDHRRRRLPRALGPLHLGGLRHRPGGASA